MAELKRVSFDPSDVRLKLAQRGLTIEILKKAAQEYYLAWTRMSPHHPRIYGGFNGWAEAIRSLRDDLIPDSWISDDHNGVNYVVSPSGDLAITPASGNHNTGQYDPESDQNVEPRTKNDKGPMIQDAVKINYRLLYRYMFDDQEQAALQAIQQAHQKQSRATWILLVFLDQQAREIRAELSLPTGFSDDQYVDKWDERIILPSTPFGDVSSVQTDSPEPTPQSPEITIDIKRIG